MYIKFFIKIYFNIFSMCKRIKNSFSPVRITSPLISKHPKIK